MSILLLGDVADLLGYFSKIISDSNRLLVMGKMSRKTIEKIHL